jgi:hypothetical protein
MSTAQIRGWLEDALEDIARLMAPTDDGTATHPAIVHASHRLQDARPALPGGTAYDGDRISGGSSGSKPPPGWDQDDRAKADRDEAHRRAKRIRDDADWLVRMVMRTNPRVPSDKDRSLSNLNAKGEPGCAHCQSIGKWDDRAVEKTLAKGNLTEPIDLCWWCYKFTLDTGALPTRKQLEDHHAGVRVKRSA